jgi:hypothetical protein
MIHVKGGHVSHPDEFFLEDSPTDAVATAYPYPAHPIERVRNSEDIIYSESNGATMSTPIRFLTSEFTGGMVGEITTSIDPNATPTVVRGISDPRPPDPRPTTTLTGR